MRFPRAWLGRFATPAIACVSVSTVVSWPVSLLAANVTALTGETYEGSAAFDNGVTITPKIGPATKLDFSNILRARFTDEPADTGGSYRAGVILQNGARLAGAPGSLSEPALKFPKYNISVPPQEVAWLVEQNFPESLAEKLPVGATGVLLPKGDFFEGSIRSADADAVKVVSPIFGPRTFNVRQKEVLAVVLQQVKAPPAAYEVGTTDGFLFFADAIGADRSSLVIRTSSLGALRIEAKELAEIRAGAGRYLPLTDLKPSRVDAPAGRVDPPAFAIDKALDGQKLAASGQYLSHGFEAGTGVVATWELPAGFTLLVGQVALSPSVEGETRLAFAVYADGRPVFRSAAYGSLDGPKSIRATIAGARMLSLRVEPAPGSKSLAGAGVWIEPTLIKR